MVEQVASLRIVSLFREARTQRALLFAAPAQNGAARAVAIKAFRGNEQRNNQSRYRDLIRITSHGPGGATLHRRELKALASNTRWCERWRPWDLDGDPVVEQAVVIGDMTRPWGLGGLRVGWMANRSYCTPAPRGI
ncbi:MAG: hypothetical protein ACJ8CB_09995 [Ktedonobacteraceae bacterium]